MAITAAQLQVQVTSDVSAALGGLGRVNSALTGVGRFFTSAAASALGFVAATAGIAGISGGLSALSSAAFGLNSQLEQAAIGFETMLGGAQPAADFIQQLAAFAARTPFDFPDLLTASQRLVAMGVAARDVIPFLTATGAAASAFGAGREGLDRINRALTQMQAKTTVQAEEMRQLAETGVPAWQILADAIGTSVPEAMKLVEKRTVTAGTFINAFIATAQQRWVPAFERQATTFAGAMSNLRDAARFAAAEALTPLFDAVRDGALALQALIRTPGFGQFIGTLRGGVAGAVAAFRELAPVIGGQLLAAFERLSGFAAANLPAALASIAAAWEVMRPAVAAVAAALPGLIDQLGPALTPVLQNLGPILAGVAAAFTTLAAASAIGAVAAAIAGLLTPMGLLVAAVGLLTAAWVGDWGNIRTTLTPIFEEIGQWLGERLPGFLAALQAGLTTVAQIVSEVVSSAFATWRDRITEVTLGLQTFGATLRPLIGPVTELGNALRTLQPFLQLLSPTGFGVAAGQTLAPGINESLRQALATQTPTGAALFSRAVGAGGGPVQVTFNLGGVNAADPAQVRQLLDRMAQLVAGVVGAAETAEPSPPTELAGVLP